MNNIEFLASQNQQEERLFEPITFDGREPDSLQQLPFYQQVNLTRYDEYLAQNYVPVIDRVDNIRLTEDISIDVYGDINEPWFLGQDIARIMDYTENKSGNPNVSQLILKLSPFDYCTFNVNGCDITTNYTTSKYARNTQQKIFVSEAGIYKLFAVSRKPHVKKYYDIIIHTLQNIRRGTNEYIVTENTYFITQFRNNTTINSRCSIGGLINGVYKTYGIELDLIEVNKVAAGSGIIELDEQGHITGYNKELVKCNPYHNNINEPVFYTIDYFKSGSLELIGSYIFEHYYIPKTYKK